MPTKSRQRRALAVARELEKLFPGPRRTALRYKTNWELLVAVILSAQCTDKKVNEVTQELFKKYRRVEDYIQASPKEFEKDIRPAGFYRAKAKNILASAKLVKERFGGRVPNTMEELLELPGVARKTANVVLQNAFEKAEGVAVDTHVKRLSLKFGLTAHEDPVKIERDLMGQLPRREWADFAHRLIEYGRFYAPARSKRPHPLRRFEKT